LPEALLGIHHLLAPKTLSITARSYMLVSRKAEVRMDRHDIALISIIGISLDLLGGMYLAYDLLGGEHGPLRLLTRGVTYGLFFGVGFGLALGPAFGVAGGLALGVTFAQEFFRASEGKFPSPWRLIFLWSMIRGLGFGIGAAFVMGRDFGIWFGGLSGFGQMLAYRIGFAPTVDFEPDTRPRLRKRQLLGALNRTVGYVIGGLVSGLLAHEGMQGLKFGLIAGVAIGTLSAVLAAIVPYIEWKVDHLPARLLGAIGAGLVVLGFVLQSLQYWVTLLDVPVK
jgi:hypothetical protein